MNEIFHRRIVIDLDIWAPFKKDAEKDIDHFLCLKKEHKLFGHCGNVVIRFEEISNAV